MAFPKQRAVPQIDSHISGNRRFGAVGYLQGNIGGNGVFLILFQILGQNSVLRLVSVHIYHSGRLEAQGGNPFHRFVKLHTGQIRHYLLFDTLADF